MTVYLIWIGSANAVLMVLMIIGLNEQFADGLMRRWSYSIPESVPFRFGEYGRAVLWWLIVSLAYFAGTNFAAAGWPREYARFIVMADVVLFACLEGMAIGASFFSKRWGSGIWVTHFLWIGQGAWGVSTLL
jgi:hypothetical protein